MQHVVSPGQSRKPDRSALAPPLLRRAAIVAAGAFAAAVVWAVPAAAEGPVSAARLVVVDAVAATLTVLDAATDERLASFATPGRIGNVVSSPSGRWVYATHSDANRVTILDSGLRLESHGDHADLIVGAPYVRATLNPGRKPIDFWTGNGMATVHNDDDGTLAILDERVLEISIEVTKLKGAGTGHNNAVVLEDTVLLSHVPSAKVSAYALADGKLVETFESCPGAHGWTTRGTTAAAVGCTDGVMLFSKSGGVVTMQKIGEPAGSPDNARVSYTASHPAHELIVGNFGQGVAVIRPGAAELQPVPLSANPIRFAFTRDGQQVIVLTLDGQLHAFDPAAGRVLWSTQAVAPVDTTVAGAPRPMLAVGESVTYVSDPPDGRIVKIDLTDGQPVGAPIAVGGTPTLIVLVHLAGHDD
jgi:hypothetical protein